MKTLLLAAALAASQCNAGPEPKPVPGGEVNCISACANLAVMSCPESLPTSEGATCEMVCENAVGNGLRIPLRCYTEAPSCAAAKACQ